MSMESTRTVPGDYNQSRLFFAGELPRLDEFPQVSGATLPCGLICGFERNEDIVARFKIGGHVGYRIADADRLDISSHLQARAFGIRRVGGQRQWLVGWQMKFHFINLIEDRL